MFHPHARVDSTTLESPWAITLVALSLLVSAARAAELPAPKILRASPHYPQPPGTWVAENVLDKVSSTEYASDNQGVKTFIDFDFGKPVTIGAFRHWNRSSPEDVVKASRLVFSDDPAFDEKDPSEIIAHTSQTQSVVYRFPPHRARYVRWQVTDITGSIKSNQGAREIAFFDEQGAPPPPSSLFVAPNGSDRWSGTLSEPNAQGTDGPVASLARARNVLRSLRAEGPLPAGFAVKVRGGKYYLKESLVLAAQDSGTREQPTVFQAYPGEKPILSGGRVVSGWRAHQGQILCAEVPEARGGWLRTRQLFYKGKRMPCARWPKLDPAEPLTSGWAFTEGPADDDPATTFRYAPGTFRHRWAKPKEVRVRAFMGHGWFMKDLPIKEIDEKARVISLAYDSWNPDLYPWYSPCVFTAANRFYIENALEELDQPGEWCLHGDDGRLYFWPPEGAGTDPEVVLPRLERLIDIRGGSWITLAGFTFTETLDGDDLHPEGTHGTNAMGLRLGPRYGGTTVRLRGASHCRIERNHFRDVGGNALYLEDENDRNLVSRNEFSGAGFAAVCLAGSPTQQPRHNEVSDNYIHHCGVINKYVAGVFLGMSDGNRIRHNRIEYLPHHAINLSDNPKGRNHIEYNDLRWVCQEISDNGAINCWMEQPHGDTERCGHVIRFNYIADIYGLENVNSKLVRSRNFPVSGIYLDSVTSNCVVYGNVIVRVGMLGIVVQNGKNNLIENNVIVDCPIGIRFQDAVLGYKAFARYAGFMTGNVLHRNIYSRTQPGSIPIALSVPLEVVGGEARIVAFCDENLYHGVPGNACRVMQRSWKDDGRNRDYTGEEWQRLGFDQGSLVGDPLFVDPSKDDYRLQPDSPALKLGFIPIPVEKIGIRAAGSKNQGSSAGRSQ